MPANEMSLKASKLGGLASLNKPTAADSDGRICQMIAGLAKLINRRDEIITIKKGPHDAGLYFLCLTSWLTQLAVINRNVLPGADTIV